MEEKDQSLFKTGNPLLKTITVEDPAITCVLCRSPKLDEVSLGPLYYLDQVAVHYFCVLFSSNLRQEGEDFEGILGFMPEDIKKEAWRARYLKCAYCQKYGASVGCCDKRCRVNIHFPCGLVNQVNYQFLGNYESFCIKHSMSSEPRKPGEDHKCPVCLCNILGEEELYVSASCCKSAILHKSCAQQMAFSAGYFFKCPTCNSENLFRDELRSQGVFVPEQDASWELEPNAFQELLYQYSKCDAEVCKCPRGREYGANKGDWLLARCRICGSAGVHRQCGNLQTIANWACVPCLEVEARTEREKKAFEPPILEGAHPGPSTSTCTSQDNIERAQEEDNDFETLARIHIAKECRNYFPYGRVQIEKFVKARSLLPDWRRRELDIVLIDVFNNELEIGAVSLSQPLPVPEVISSLEPEPVPSNRSLNQAPVPVPRRTRAQAKKGPKRRRKRCFWQKGVIKRVNYKKARQALEKKKNENPEVTVEERDDKLKKGRRGSCMKRESARLVQKNCTKDVRTRSGGLYQFL